MILKIIIYILLFIILLIALIVLIPLKIEINYKTEDNSKKDKIKKEVDKKLRKNYLKVYILNFIPLPKFKLEVNKNSKLLENKGVIKNIINTIFSLSMEYIGMQKSTEALINKKDSDNIKNSIYFKELRLSFGYNFYNVLVNTYLIAFLNALLAMYVSKNDKMFNLKRFKYDTYISNNQIYNFKFFGIVKFKLANTISIFIKVFIKLRKVARINGKGNTSNRRLNDDCYDFS